MAHTYKDLHLLLLDVGEHMQPYLPLLHRLIFNVLNLKLLHKPLHEVAVVLYGTEGTRHELQDPDDPTSYAHVTVLRPLQNVGSYLELEQFQIAADPPPPRRCAGGGGEAGGGAEEGDGRNADAEVEAALGPVVVLEGAELEAAAAALQRRVEAAGAGVAGRGDTAAAASRAARLFGRPGPKADWADGLVVALDLLARAKRERFEGDKKLKNIRLLLVSNMLGLSEPLDEEMTGALVGTCEELGIFMDVACLDHFVPPPPDAASAAAAAPTPSSSLELLSGSAGGAGTAAYTASDVAALAALPSALADSRRRNLEQLHEIKARLRNAPFRHLRQPAELLCLFNAVEVSLTASLADLRLTPGPGGMDVDGQQGVPDITIKVKLYKKTQQAKVAGWTSQFSEPAPAPAAPVVPPDLDVPMGDGGAAAAAAAAAGGGGGGAYGDGGAFGDDGGGGEGEDPASRRGFLREVEYEDATTGEKFSRDTLIKGYPYGCQMVPLDETVEHLAHVRFDKDFSLLGFIRSPHRAVPQHRLIAEPSVVVGADPTAVAALAALARVMNEAGEDGVRPGMAGIARFKNRSTVPQLALLTPHLSPSTDVPDCLLLSPLPYAEDVRTFFFPTFRNEQEAGETAAALAEARAARSGNAGGAGTGTAPSVGLPSQLSGTPSGGALGSLAGSATQGQVPAEPGMRFEKLQPTQEQQDAALDLVRSLDLGPFSLSLGVEPRPEALPPQHAVNPHLQRMYGFVTSRALDQQAQYPDPEEDPLVELLFRPHGRYWAPGAEDALRRAEEKLGTKERTNEGAAGRHGRRSAGDVDGGEADVGGDVDAVAVVAAADAAAAAGVRELVFDPSASAGTSARVTRVGELSAVEDFRSMVAAGKDTAASAVEQLQALVLDLVRRSVGDQLFGKAVQCVQVLRSGCVAVGLAGAFNAFLSKLAAECGRADFVSQLVSQRTTLISTADLPGGGAGPQQLGGGGGVPHYEYDGGAVEPAAARAFLEEHSAAATAAAAGDVADEATLPAAVVDDNEFDDMD